MSSTWDLSRQPRVPGTQCLQSPERKSSLCFDIVHLSWLLNRTHVWHAGTQHCTRFSWEQFVACIQLQSRPWGALASWLCLLGLLYGSFTSSRGHSESLHTTQDTPPMLNTCRSLLRSPIQMTRRTGVHPIPSCLLSF